MAYAQTGATLRAAEWLGINYRTLERRMAKHPELRAAANRGRAAYQAKQPRPPHGTVRGYQWELYRRPEVQPCALCRAANAADTAKRNRAYRARRRLDVAS